MFESEINPDNIERADLVVSIPSYNEADSISYPATQASLGIEKYFSDKKAVIINCDNNSPDNTREAFLKTETKVPKIYISTPPGVKGKGNNFKNLFKKVVELKAKAVVVVDADLKSITPEWIQHLGEPLDVHRRLDPHDPDLHPLPPPIPELRLGHHPAQGSISGAGDLERRGDHRYRNGASLHHHPYGGLRSSVAPDLQFLGHPHPTRSGCSVLREVLR